LDIAKLTKADNKTANSTQPTANSPQPTISFPPHTKKSAIKFYLCTLKKSGITIFCAVFWALFLINWIVKGGRTQGPDRKLK
jgi:hypothetical protein